MGVTHIHLSLESLDGKTRFSDSGESDPAMIAAGIESCNAIGLRVELNYLVLRGKNWGMDHARRLIDFAASHGLDISLLDLLYSWNSKLEHFHVPAEEIRAFLANDCGLSERIVVRDGTVQTEFLCGGISIRLRDFRARPEASICVQCAADSHHLGLTPPQLSTAGTLAFCSHSRIAVGKSADEAAAAYVDMSRRLGQSDLLHWIRT